MSYVEIYPFDKNGNCMSPICVRNAFCGAFAVWRRMEAKYLPLYRPEYIDPAMTDEEVRAKYGDLTRLAAWNPNEAMRDVYDLFNREDVSLTDRIVLGTTFDDVLVKRENFLRVVEAFESFDGDTNLKEQAAVIRKFINDPDITAIGWNATSVNCDTWANAGCSAQDETEGAPYNYMTQDKHWWLFDELPEK